MVKAIFVVIPFLAGGHAHGIQETRGSFQLTEEVGQAKVRVHDHGPASDWLYDAIERAEASENNSSVVEQVSGGDLVNLQNEDDDLFVNEDEDTFDEIQGDVQGTFQQPLSIESMITQEIGKLLDRAENTEMVGFKDDWIYIPVDESFTFVQALTYSFSALFLFCGLIYIWKQNYEAHRRALKKTNPDYFEF